MEHQVGVPLSLDLHAWICGVIEIHLWVDHN